MCVRVLQILKRDPCTIVSGDREPTGVVPVPRLLSCHSLPHPHSRDELLSLQHWTTAVLSVAIVHSSVRAFVSEESHRPYLRLDEYISFSKGCGSPSFGGFAVHHCSGDSASIDVQLVVARTITMRSNYENQ